MSIKHINIFLAALFAVIVAGCTAPLKDDGPIRVPPPEQVPLVPIEPIEIGDDTRVPPRRTYLEERDLLKLTPPRTTGTPPRPAVFGETVDFDKRKLRFATWNVHTLTPNTATDDKHKVKLKPVGAATEQTYNKKDAIFKILKYNGVHVAALQEVYGPRFGASALAATEHGYQIIKGDPIKGQGVSDPEDLDEDSNANVMVQWCAIAALPEFGCVHHRTEANSRTNWVLCKIPNATGQKHEVFFGCSHYDTGSGSLASNIKVFFDQLDMKKPASNEYFQPRIPGTGIGGDNLIFGVDANSSPFSPSGVNPWNDHSDKWCCKPVVPGQPIPNSKLHLPKLKDYDDTSTKFAKEGQRPNQRPYFSTDPHQRNIDFIGHRLNRNEIEYDDGSMAALNLELMHADLVAKLLWLMLYNVGDHIPVKADYTVK